jgi:hypothetical protein
MIQIFQEAATPGTGGHLRLVGNFLGFDFITQTIHGIRGRTDQDQFIFFQECCKIGILSHKTPTDPDATATSLLQGLQKERAIQIGAACQFPESRKGRQGKSVIGFFNEKRVILCIQVKGDCLKLSAIQRVEFLRCPYEANGGFTTVYDPDSGVS